MAIWGDYHTHTKYSHGHGTIMQNVDVAVLRGLKEIAITDHGFRHMTYNVRRTAVPAILKDIEEAKKKHPEINIYFGIESNLSSRHGRIDVYDQDLPYLDLILCGYHKLVKSDTMFDYFKFFIPNLIFGKTTHTSLKQKIINTDAYIRAIERYDIDILTHPKNSFDADILEVAKACKYYGTYIEINGKGNYLTDYEWEKLASRGNQFIINSDAHEPQRVGEVSKPMEIVERLSLPKEQIANWDKLPRFRSRIRKGLYE